MNARDAGVAPPTSAHPILADRVRRDFPVLYQEVHGKPLVYLDNAATTHKPEAVIHAVSSYYRDHNSNVHRGVHTLSQRATDLYEDARDAVVRFVNAPDRRELIFTRGATEAINLVAHSYGTKVLGPDDEVLITWMEHHSNIVPWQLACQRSGATLKVVPITDAGELDMDAFHELLGPKTRIVSVVHTSNALGTVNPVADIVRAAHAVDAVVVVDGAQAVPHAPIDVQALGCDFYAFSGHKMYGPTGVGALWGRYDLLAEMPPYQGGGDMIRHVTFDRTLYAKPPARFEAGTPNIAGVIGLGAAVVYLEGVGMSRVAAHEAMLLQYTHDALSSIEGLRFIGTASDKAAVVSFVLDGVHPHDIGTIVDSHGVAIRTGHHCAQPVMERFGVPATARASVAIYNTPSDIDALVVALQEVRKVFA